MCEPNDQKQDFLTSIRKDKRSKGTKDFLYNLLIKFYRQNVIANVDVIEFKKFIGDKDIKRSDNEDYTVFENVVL